MKTTLGPYIIDHSEQTVSQHDALTNETVILVSPEKFGYATAAVMCSLFQAAYNEGTRREKQRQLDDLEYWRKTDR